MEEKEEEEEEEETNRGLLQKGNGNQKDESIGGRLHHVHILVSLPLFFFNYFLLTRRDEWRRHGQRHGHRQRKGCGDGWCIWHVGTA